MAAGTPAETVVNGISNGASGVDYTKPEDFDPPVWIQYEPDQDIEAENASEEPPTSSTAATSTPDASQEEPAAAIPPPHSAVGEPPVEEVEQRSSEWDTKVESIRGGNTRVEREVPSGQIQRVMGFASLGLGLVMGTASEVPTWRHASLDKPPSPSHLVHNPRPSRGSQEAAVAVRWH